MTELIDQIRSFNRNHTARLGLMRQTYLEAGLNYTESRVIFELAERPNWTAREIATTFHLNEGYVSRMMARLEKTGLVQRRPSPDDGRVMLLSLTDAGQGAANELIKIARDEIGSWLADVTEHQAQEIARKMTEIDEALTGRKPETTLRDIAPGDAGWLIQQHGEYYTTHDGFDMTFEALVAEILSDFLKSRDANRERAWIAQQGQTRLGSVFCVKGPAPDTAKLRLFYLVPEARGLGLGKTLLSACTDFARTRGYRKLTLWTHASHVAACQLYKKSGFVLNSSRPVTSFGQELEEQHWTLDLTA